MQLKSKLVSSWIVASATLLASIIFPIIPCRIAPAIPNPNYEWSFCSLNPDILPTTLSIKEYLGYTSSLTEAYFITLLTVFIVLFIFFHFTTRGKK